MYQFVASSALSQWDVLVLLSVGPGSLITILVLSQMMLSSCGLPPCHCLNRMLPRLGLEWRLRLNFQHWLVKMARFKRCANCREKLVAAGISPQFLLRRNGRNIFDFFKTVSFNDVSPPVWV